MELLTLIPVVGFALAWKHWQGSSAASALLHAVSVIIIALFLASLVDMLLPATVALLATGTLLAGVEAYRSFRQKSHVPVPIGIFALLCFLFWLVHSGSSYLYYDEYSHWGVFLKEMLAYDRLWGVDTNALHPHYLPGASLWQYFFAVFSSKPEGAAFLAQFVLLLTPLVVLWERTGWHQTLWHLAILMLITFMVSNFGHGFASLYVDHILGIWFVGLLLNILLEERLADNSRWMSYLLPLTVIVLIKSTGVFFALSAAGIISLLLFVNKSGETPGLLQWSRLRHATIFFAVATVLSGSVLVAWESNRDVIGTSASPTSTRGVVSLVLAGGDSTGDARQTELTSRFVDVVLHQQISKDELSSQYNAFSYPLMPLFTQRFRLTTAAVFGLSVVWFLLLWRAIIPPARRRNWAIVGGSVWLVAVAYVFSLYIGYRSVADSENGFALSSYVRYAHSMLLPVMLLCFAPLLPAFMGARAQTMRIAGNLKAGRASVIFSIGLAMLYFFERPFLDPLYVTRPIPDIRASIEPVTKKLRTTIGDARLWVLFPAIDSNGFFSHLLQYQLTPGLVRVEENPSVLLTGQTALKSELRNWEYMWFPVEDPELDAALERLIGTDVTQRLYRIDASEENILFVPVAGVL